MNFMKNNFDVILRQIDKIDWKDVSIYILLTIVEQVIKQGVVKPSDSLIKIFDRSFKRYVFELGAKNLSKSMKGYCNSRPSFQRPALFEETNENVDIGLEKKLQKLAKAPKNQKDFKTLDKVLYFY